jgi:hypothetical protein
MNFIRLSSYKCGITEITRHDPVFFPFIMEANLVSQEIYMKRQELAQILIKRILMAGILVLGAFYVLVLVWAFSKRITYPFELDWIEGGFLNSVSQILAGNKLYGPPTITYVPFLYPPVYFYLSALAAKIFGVTLFSLRLVSVCATLVSITSIFLIVFDQTHDRIFAMMSAGLFAGLYPVTRFWLDMARVDSLFVMFFLLFIYAIRHDSSLRSQSMAGIFAALAALTKQTALSICIPIIVIYFLFDWKRHWPVLATAFGVYGGISLLFILASGNWYLYYCYELLFQQTEWLASYSVIDFINNYLTPGLPIASLTVLLLLLGWSQRGQRQRFLIWLVIFASTFAASYITKAKVGAVNNVVIPTFAVLSILFGIGVSEILTFLSKVMPKYKLLAEIVIYTLCLFQMAHIMYDPFKAIPTNADYKTGTKMVKLIKKFDGNVYVPNSSLPMLAGKQPFAHPSAIWDVMRGNKETMGKKLMTEELEKVVSDHLFDAIIVLDQFNYFPELEKYYILSDQRYDLVDLDWPTRVPVYVVPGPK